MQLRDPSSSYMKDRKFQKMLVNELAHVSRVFFSERLSGIPTDNFDFFSEIERFLDLYSDRVLKDNSGGSGFHNAFWIYLVARLLKPALIVESGVWKGHTCWLLETASPEAVIHGFDINLGNLEYKKGRVNFHEHDWNQYQFGTVNPERSLVFFDCHVNHARRIIEAGQRGFRHLLFDDNPPVHKLYGYGLPGFPTADMIYKGVGLGLLEVSWCWGGEEKSYQINRDEVVKARELVQVHEVFPDVGGPTMYGGFSFLTYVQI